MNMQTMITLRASAATQDAYGVTRTEWTTTDVYARVESVSASEFFDGGQNGLKPEYRFIVSVWEYNDEMELAYDGQLYSVYRIYRRSLDRVELYAERKVGVHGD